eukprot:TRINITY_DN13509_c0_g2_i1.p1 TRINITY_DN13509_c0_g2~~TRINITY_DN13509_c0_g2_i1.p1  ORF type:complete len:452 (-),score=59.18 TRINITY_DN13509_c0_g2_i1:92-1447(-)
MGCAASGCSVKEHNKRSILNGSLQLRLNFKFDKLTSIRNKYNIKSALSFDSTRALFVLEDIANPRANFVGRVFCLKINDSQLAKITNKIETIMRFNTPFIAPYTCMATSDTHTYLVMDVSPYKFTATEALLSGTFATEEKLKSSLYGVFKALAVLHHHSIVHGEISPSKLLCDHNGRLALHDFTMEVETATQLYIGAERSLVAPEVAGGYLPSAESDVWELGATVKWLVGASKVSSELKMLLGMMMKDNEKERITMANALAHKWFTSNPKERITINETAKTQFAINKAVLSLANKMTSKANQLRTAKDINKLRAKIHSFDIMNTQKVPFSLLAKQVDEQVMKGVEEFEVNYNDVLGWSMALVQFVVQERCAELFTRLSEYSSTISKDSVRALLRAIGQEEVYAETEESLESFIGISQTHPRAKFELTYCEFMKVVRFLDLDVTEDLLKNFK